MLDALSCRGPDSAGVAIYNSVREGHWLLQVKLGDGVEEDLVAEQVEAAVRSFAEPFQLERRAAYWSCLLPDSAALKPLIKSVERVREDVEVVSAGKSLRIVKQVGSPAALDSTYHVSNAAGTHALGHTRLSTESKVDLSHSQPFWSHGYADLAIVHNGHITNYHQLRRRYEQTGVRFYTENDSEVIAIYLAKQLQTGLNLEGALHQMLNDLDGSYSCLAATATEFGFVKDPFAFKPLVYADTADFVAVATEEVALRSALPGAYSVSEAQVREVRVWQN
jgi:glutamate synthase domain-containing protein 1